MYREQTTINGKRVVHTFTILFEGWEADNYGWVTEDGKIWTTNHGRLCEMSAQELREKIEETEASLAGLKLARDWQ